MANASARPEQDGRAAVRLEAFAQACKLGLEFADSLRIAIDGSEMRRQQIEDAARAFIEVDRLAQPDNVHFARTDRGERGTDQMLHAKRPIELLVKSGVMPFRPADQIAQPRRLENLPARIPVQQKRMLVHVPRDDFPYVREGFSLTRVPIRSPSNTSQLRIDLGEMQVVAVHQSHERFHDACLAGGGRLVCIQLLDSLHDGVKVTLPQPAHSLLLTSIGPNAPCDLRLCRSSFVPPLRR